MTNALTNCVNNGLCLCTRPYARNGSSQSHVGPGIDFWDSALGAEEDVGFAVGSDAFGGSRDVVIGGACATTSPSSLSVCASGFSSVCGFAFVDSCLRGCMRLLQLELIGVYIGDVTMRLPIRGKALDVRIMVEGVICT